MEVGLACKGKPPGAQKLTKVMIATPSTFPCLDVRSADSQNLTLQVIDTQHMTEMLPPLISGCAIQLGYMKVDVHQFKAAKACLPPTRILICDAFQS